MTLRLLTMEGRTASTAVPEQATVLMTKEAIQDLWGIPKEQQKLVVGGRVVDDLGHRQLGMLLKAVARPVGGAAEQAIDVTVVKRNADEAGCLAKMLRRGYSPSKRLGVRWDEVPEELVGSPDVLLCAVRVDSLALSWFPEEVRSNRELVTEAVQRNWRALEYAAPELREQKDLIWSAVSQCGQALQWASPALKNDYAVVHQAVTTDGLAFTFASEELRKRSELAWVAVGNCPCGRALEAASVELRDEHDLVKRAVSRVGRALQFASERLRSDRDLVLLAIATCQEALSWASADLRNDSVVVLAAVRQCGTALAWASVEVRTMRDVVLEAVRNTGEALEFASEQLQDDTDLALQAIRHTGKALRFASPRLKDDEMMVREAVKNDPRALEFASVNQQNNMAIVQEAVEGGAPEAVRYLSEMQQADYELLVALVECDGRVFDYAPEHLRTDRKFQLLALQAGLDLGQVPGDVSGDAELLLAALAGARASFLKGSSDVKNNRALRFAKWEQLNDKDFVASAVAAWGSAIRWASAELREEPELWLLALENLFPTQEHVKASPEDFVQEINEIWMHAPPSIKVNEEVSARLEETRKAAEAQGTGSGASSSQDQGKAPKRPREGEPQ